jgi:hypothetical protein
MALLLTSAALADDVSDAVDSDGARLDVGVSTQYDSNVFFVSGDEVSSPSAVAQLASGYRWQGELTGVDVAVDGRYQEYTDGSLPTVSAIGAAITVDRAHEFGSTRVQLAYRDESSLLDVLNNNGDFVGDQRQHTASASLHRMFELSETSSIVATLAGSRVKYIDTPAGVQQDDYDFTSGGSQWEWQYSERVTFGAGVVGSWYDSNGKRFTNEVTTIGPVLSMRYELGETMSGSVEASYRRSESKTVFLGFIDQRDSGADYYGRAGVAKQFERGYLDLDASRSVQPGSNGSQEIRDEVTASFGREVSERIMLHGGVTALKSAPTNDGSVGAANDRRTAFAGDLGVDYVLAERVTLTAGYRYLRQNTDAADTDARAQTVVMTLRWELGGTAL